MTRTLETNYGPNAALVYRKPGRGSRKIIDTRFEVDLVVDGKWKTVRKFGDGNFAHVFAQGASYALTGGAGQ